VTSETELALIPGGCSALKFVIRGEYPREGWDTGRSRQIVHSPNQQISVFKPI
jgi:hypothetical protein